MIKTINLLCFVFTLLSFSCKADKVVVDTDAGADDALAILLLLRAEASRIRFSPRYEIVAITCSYGNTKEENVEINVLKTLTVANRSDIPVYGGAKKPLLGNFTGDNHFGNDGFGDIEFDQEITAKVDKSMNAAIALIELSKKFAGELSLLVIGPLTNVALAMSLDAGFTKRIRTFIVMGASVAGVGNIRPNVEFNFAADPESDSIFLSSVAKSQVVLLPWEVGLKANISKEWRKDELGSLTNSPYIRFLNAIEEVGLSGAERTYIPTDGMTAALMLQRDVATSVLETNVQAVIDGKARGSVLVDYKLTLPANARIVQSIDVDKFKKVLEHYLS